MRVLGARGYWQPRRKISGLRRYAFLGDSYVFGQGVGPQETFPARFERHFNELSSDWAIEAVNHGVSGYNLWNSWLSFKNTPQVYDGVVLTLCANDAQLFGRTFDLHYEGSAGDLWEPSHDVHHAVVACFDDIARFSEQTELRTAICYYTTWPEIPLSRQSWSIRIAEIIRDLCTARSLEFVDITAHLSERNIAPAQLVVSEADYHPSALTHDAAARHLALALRDKNWLGGECDPERGAAAAIVAAVRSMVEGDAYPPDIALDWAARTLDAKLLLERRKLSSSAGHADKALENVAEEIATERGLWHCAARATATHAGLLTTENGAVGHFWLVQEEARRLEELALALRSLPDASVVNALSRPGPPRSDFERVENGSAARNALEVVGREFRANLSAVRLLREQFAESWLGGVSELAHVPTHLDGIEKLVERALDELAECSSLLSEFSDRDFDPETAAAKALPELLGQGTSSIVARLRYLAEATKVSLRDTVAPQWPICTTIEAIVCGEGPEGAPACVFEVQANAVAPYRLPLTIVQNFLPDGRARTLLFRFPVFYAGRIIASFRIPPALSGTVETSVKSVQIYADPAVRRSVALESFGRDTLGRMTSPPLVFA
jgi:hypothetical protein